MWFWIGAGVFLVTLVFAYALCRVAALADLHAMARYAAKPKPVADPWELPRIGGGIYDWQQRRDFDVSA